jgi:hypothetical protein
MLNLDFAIRRPLSSRFSNLKSWHGSTPFANKHWEFQISKTADIIAVNLNFTVQGETDHAGLRCGFGLIGFAVEFNFYDSGHLNAPTANPTLWEVKFCIMDRETGFEFAIRTELCYSVFEAEQLVTDEGHKYDVCRIIPSTPQ